LSTTKDEYNESKKYATDNYIVPPMSIKNQVKEIFAVSLNIIEKLFN
jgi:hypothetical protein